MHPGFFHQRGSNFRNDRDRPASFFHLDASPHTISRTTAAKLRAEVIPKEAICYAKIGAALLLNRRRITTADCCIDNNMTALLPRTTELNYKYAFHWMSTVDFGEHTNPGAVPSLSEGYQSVLPIALPPLEEQTAIADFLDKKTAKIDDLIAKKEELLRLLAEQRTALITHAVTKGLDSNAPMKPSGIDWLGDVPEGWNIVQLRRVLRGISQGWSPSADDRVASLDEWAVLKAGCVNGGVYNSAEHKALPSNLVPRTDLEVQNGDILMCRASGSLHLIGSVAMVGETRPKLIFSDKTYRLEVETKLIDREFFTYAMSSHHMREQIINSVSGAEGMANNIPQSAVLSYVQAVPEIQIQRLIVRYLGGKLAKLTEIEASAKSAINVLNEYRTALITNAVTGKIKVA